MVTTAIAWLAGLVLVGVASSPARFQRAFVAATRSPIDARGNATSMPESTRAFVRTTRLLALAVGAVCVALGVLGTLSFLR